MEASCNCEKKKVAKGLCRNCYNKIWKRKNGLIKGPKPKVLCHCGEPQVGKNLCRKHYDEKFRNKEKQKEYSKKYSLSGKKSVVRHKRRAAIRNAEGSYTSQDVLSLRESQTSCNGCGKDFSEKLLATLDHIIPLARGGSNWPSNLQLLCGPCNSSKGCKTHDEWKQSISR